MKAMASQGQHVVATTVTTSAQSTYYHGAAWTDPSPIGSDISPDADGVYPAPGFYFLIDLSHMLSRSLGKQMSMTSTYRVTGIKIGVKNVNDLDDNDRGIVLGGYLWYHEPTKHKIDAIQACRKIERASEANQIDPDSLFIRTEDRYSGFRYNWSNDQQVSFPTNALDVGGYNSLTGRDEWSIYNMLDLYGTSLGPEEGCEKGRQLWLSKTGHVSLMRWALSFNNAMHVDPAPSVADPLGTPYLIENPAVGDFEYVAAAGRHIDVMGGLILGQVIFSNTIPNGDLIPDDYQLVVEVSVEGWSSW